MEPDAADWSGDDTVKRPSGRISQPRIANFETRTPPAGNDLHVAATATLAGAGVPAIVRPNAVGSPMLDHDGDIITPVGSRPLTDLTFESQPPVVQQAVRVPAGTGARLDTQAAANVDIRSRAGWVVLLVLMVLGVAAGVLIAMQSQS
jgi:hypothetical protein